MGFTTRRLNQTATHWVATPDGYGGYTFSAPELLRCRWEDRNEIVRLPMGEEVTSTSVVFLEDDVAEGDYLYQGESEEVDPTSVAGATRVMRFNKATDIRNLNVLRVAYL